MTKAQLTAKTISALNAMSLKPKISRLWSKINSQISNSLPAIQSHPIRLGWLLFFLP
jgi:hypothetical protein